MKLQYFTKQCVLYRDNPCYPPWHCMTVMKCEKCGEYYEPCCEFEHICKEQNSYSDDEVSKDEKI